MTNLVVDNAIVRAFEISIAQRYEGKGTITQRAREAAILVVQEAAVKTLARAAARAFKGVSALATLAAADAIHARQVAKEADLAAAKAAEEAEVRADFSSLKSDLKSAKQPTPAPTVTAVAQ